MPAYVIAEIEITDPTVEKYGGTFLALRLKASKGKVMLVEGAS